MQNAKQNFWSKLKQTEMKKKKKHKNVFYNQLTQIAKISDYVNKNVAYFKLQKIVNYRKSHSERDINLNNNIQTKNWKMYANNLFEQNIIKNASQIIIVVSSYAPSVSKIIIYVSLSFSTLSKKTRFQSIKKKKSIFLLIMTLT